MNIINYNKLIESINYWNENRVPILRISTPDANLNFQGVIRFYFQDSGQKVATKCISVSSANSTKDVINILIEKFRPDMKMLSKPEYGLYEVHENGDERKLELEEKPLYVQLEWNQDDREGRFFLRRLDDKKKPETSFTRSISNPEAVMKRRRLQKLEKRLEELSLEGGREAGGTLRIFGEILNKDVSYKTLLLSTKDTSSLVVKQILEKYGKAEENSSNYCLVKLVVPHSAATGENNSLKESILDDNDCPLLINQNHHESEGILTFHIRHKHRKKKPLRDQVQAHPLHPTVVEQLNQRIQMNNINNNNNHSNNHNNHNNNHSNANYNNHSNNHNSNTNYNNNYNNHNEQNSPQSINRDLVNHILPALIQVEEDVEDIFLDRVITNLKPSDLTFRLAPTYVIYMVSRYRASTLFHPELQAPSRAALFMPFTKKIALLIRTTIEVHMREPNHLDFWLANSSDLSHFYKQDKHLAYFTQEAQAILNDSILASFKYLLACKQLELDLVLNSFFDEWDGGNSSFNQILNILNELMASMRKNRVNAALTIQMFSHLFHYINKWLFDRLVEVYGRGNFVSLPNRVLGDRLNKKLALIRGWAEKQGIEQAADFHLAPITRVTLAPHELHEAFIRDFEIPFIVPSDGSSDMIRYIPNGLLDFVSYLSKIRVRDQELCIFTVQPTSSGFWNVYFKNHQPDTPEIIIIQLRKKNNSMGLSIIAARGVGQERLGIYIKNVVKNGAAALDGRLQAGDQLLDVDGNSLIDITQESAAELMQRTGPVVTLKIAKQAAIHHNLSDIINSVPSQTIVSPQAVMPHSLSDIINSVPNQPIVSPQAVVHHNMNNVRSVIPSQTIHHNMQEVRNSVPNNEQHFIPPPPLQTMSNLTSTSPLKSPKKVSWVDTQPHQSLHTLIPPSPALEPSPNAQLDVFIDSNGNVENQNDAPQATESLTLEDIDEVLSSKTRTSWLEDSAGVIGTQEVYNDPRQRIVKERERPQTDNNDIENLSFQEKLAMFKSSNKW